MKSNWNSGVLGDFLEVKGGKRLPKGVQLQTEPNTHPYVRIRDITSKKYLELNNEYEYVDDETQKTIARYIVNSGDVIISIVGTIGLVGIIGESLDNANLTENCAKLINVRELDREFLYYYLLSPAGREEIHKGTVGAVQPKLPIKNIQAIKINFPSFEEQKKIAGVLAAIDAKIAMNEEINKNLAA